MDDICCQGEFVASWGFYVVLLLDLFLQHNLLFPLVAELRDGELIHGENFSLFAAMSALEVLIIASALLSLAGLR